MGFKEIGKKIQQAREEKGLSQEQLARMIGCSQSALSNYEKGKRRLYLSHLEKLAEALEKPIEYFMESKTEDQSENIFGHDSELVRLINEFACLSSWERQLVFEYIEYLLWKRTKGGSTHDKFRTDEGTAKMDTKGARAGGGRNKAQSFGDGRQG